MCSVYGKLTSKELSDRIHECSWCGLVMDRDLNASINIQNYYMIQNTVSSTGIKAFGENVRLGSDLLLPSSLDELGIKHETLAC